MKKTIYKITVLNWEKYNSSLKKGHKCILLSTRFLDDSKIRLLTPVTRLLYLSHLLVAGESQSSHIEVSHESLVFHSGVKSQSIQSQLDLLQSLQLVTYEKTEPLLDRIGIDRIGKDRKGLARKPKTAIAVPDKPEPIGQILMARYCELWKSRYGSNPAFQKHHPKQLKDVGETNGKEKSLALLEAYFRCPDPFFVKKAHDIGTFIFNLANLNRFMETGRMVSNNEVRQMDNAVASQNTLDALRKGEI